MSQQKDKRESSVKSTLISFESLFYHEPASAVELIKKEIDVKSTLKFDAVIGTILVEIIPIHEISNLVTALSELKRYALSRGFSNFKLMLMPPYKQYARELAAFEIYWFDYLARITHNAYEFNPGRLSTAWNHQSRKILVITGIPHRYNRIRLLYKLHREKLLNDDNCVWSFFKPFSDESWKECRRFLNDVDDREFESFMQYAVKTLDDVKVVGAKFAAQTMVEDFSLPAALYSDTCLSIVTETHCYPEQPKRDISEKTWRAIINRHPFLIAGTQGNTDHLKSLGYRTFDEYFPMRYDHTDDLELTLDNIVYNTKYFLSNLHRYQNQIESDVKHNYDNFCSMISDLDKLRAELLTSQGVEENEICEFFDKTNYWNLGGNSFLEPLDQKQIQNKNQ